MPSKHPRSWPEDAYAWKQVISWICIGTDLSPTEVQAACINFLAIESRLPSEDPPLRTEFHPDSDCLKDEEGSVVTCAACGNYKLKAKCDQVEFTCGGEDHACYGWSGACCKCGADYAMGQMP